MECRQCGAQCQRRWVRVQRPVAAGLYGLGLASAWMLGGGLLNDLLEGLQRSALPVWKALLPALILWLAVVAQFARWRRVVCPQCSATAGASLFRVLDTDQESRVADGPTRRRVLHVLGATATGAVATAAGVAAAVVRNRGWVAVARNIFKAEVEKTAKAPRPEWEGAHIGNYRRLGRTNFMVSDISFGSSRVTDPAVVRRALDAGINYFDTAPDYAANGSERVLGEAIKGRRDKVFLATKFCVSDGHLANHTPVPQIIAAVEGSMRRLQTDHVDLVHIHSCDRLDRLMAPNIHEAFDRLKRQGKARFLGVSTHTPNLEEIVTAAIESGRFDVMMLAYHYGMWPNFGPLLDKAHSHDVGVVAMKTLKGAKHENLDAFRREAGAYSQAAFRWVLSNPAVSCLVVSIASIAQVNEYVYASGTGVRPADVAVLRRYDELIAGDYCQPHCGACLTSCAYDLPVNDILRYRMYSKDYQWEEEGRRLYARLVRGAEACMACPAPCRDQCPIGVPIRDRMLDAHRVLTLPA
jgi:aryl-alcohol dehydrogenase-like predicted oxidoreductase